MSHLLLLYIAVFVLFAPLVQSHEDEDDTRPDYNKFKTDPVEFQRYAVANECTRIFNPYFPYPVNPYDVNDQISYRAVSYSLDEQLKLGKEEIIDICQRVMPFKTLPSNWDVIFGESETEKCVTPIIIGSGVGWSPCPTIKVKTYTVEISLKGLGEKAPEPSQPPLFTIPSKPIRTYRPDSAYIKFHSGDQTLLTLYHPWSGTPGRMLSLTLHEFLTSSPINDTLSGETLKSMLLELPYLMMSEDDFMENEPSIFIVDWVYLVNIVDNTIKVMKTYDDKSEKNPITTDPMTLNEFKAYCSKAIVE